MLQDNDVLAAVLEQSGMRGAVYCQTQAVAPWGLRFPAQDGAIFHCVVTGTCWLSQGSEHMQLAAGDLVLVKGGAHSLSDAPKSPKLELERWLEQNAGVAARKLGGERGRHSRLVRKTVNNRIAVIAYFLASSVCACAASEPGAEQTSLNSPGDTQAAAESLLGDSLRLNSAVHSAFGRVKADLEAEPFLLFDEIHRTLPQETISNSQIFDEVADELYPHMQMGEKDELAVNVYALVRRFAELISLPRESIPAQRLAAFLSDAVFLDSLDARAPP